jgi:protein transport protein SEC61 subunit gamma-like protein
MLRKLFYQCKRAIQVARKPNKEEYLNVAKVTTIGILLIGLLGFVIMMISYFLGGMSITL